MSVALAILTSAFVTGFGAPVAAQGVEVTKSIRYAAGDRRVLDIYRPRQARGAPVIVFIFGGSWQSGEKATYSFVGDALARHGYVTVVPDYRLYPAVRYPTFLEDCAKAVRWARDNAARFGGDPNNIYIMGHSAGAYNAAMLALDGRWLSGVGLSTRQLSGFIGVSGPYDFLPLKDETLVSIFGGANRRDTQPITYVSRHAPPTLLATGTFDTIVEPSNSTRLADRMRALGDDVTLRRYPGIGHITILGGFIPPFSLLIPMLNDIDKFIHRTSRARSSG
jgi:acetyl esterase/lipase